MTWLKTSTRSPPTVTPSFLGVETDRGKSLTDTHTQLGTGTARPLLGSRARSVGVRASLKPGWKIRTADQRRAGKRERGKEQENSEGEKQDCEGERRARGIFTARTTGGLRDCLMPRLSRSEIRKHLSTQTNFYCAVTERQQTAVATTGAESDAQACIPAHPSLCDPCGVLHPFLIF